MAATLKRRGMTLDIMIEPLDSRGVRATCVFPRGLEADAPTEEEPLAKLKAMVQDHFTKKVKWVQWEVPFPGNPWLEIAGYLEGHPLTDDFMKSLEENRRFADQLQDSE